MPWVQAHCQGRFSKYSQRRFKAKRTKSLLDASTSNKVILITCHTRTYLKNEYGRNLNHIMKT